METAGEKAAIALHNWELYKLHDQDVLACAPVALLLRGNQLFSGFEALFTGQNSRLMQKALSKTDGWEVLGYTGWEVNTVV